jgi:hypothetical protein
VTLTLRIAPNKKWTQACPPDHKGQSIKRPDLQNRFKERRVEGNIVIYFMILKNNLRNIIILNSLRILYNPHLATNKSYLTKLKSYLTIRESYLTI